MLQAVVLKIAGFELVEIPDNRVRDVEVRDDRVRDIEFRDDRVLHSI